VTLSCAPQRTADAHTSKNAKIRKMWIRKEGLRSDFQGEYNKQNAARCSNHALPLSGPVR